MHVTHYSSSDREVIRFLFSSNDWADLYELHVKFRLSPAQIIDIVERLVAAGLADIDEIKAQARLTPTGRVWVVEAREGIFRSVGDNQWKTHTEELLQAPASPQSPYLPDLSLLDREFFVKLALDDASSDATT